MQFEEKKEMELLMQNSTILESKPVIHPTWSLVNGFYWLLLQSSDSSDSKWEQNN